MARHSTLVASLLSLLATSPALLAQAELPRGPALRMPTTFGFVENRGQWPEPLRLVGDLKGARIRAETAGLALQLPPHGGQGSEALVRLEFVDCNDDAEIRGEALLPGTHSFFIGNEPSKWRSGARRFARVRYEGLYPGIDLVLRESGGALEYDLIVAAGADLTRFRVRCCGAEGVALQADGSLVMETPAGPLTQRFGRSWQVLPSGEHRDIAVGWKLADEDCFGIEAPGRDPALALVIDPDLVWATYMGGVGGAIGDIARAIAWTPDGDLVVVGTVEGDGFLMTAGAYQHAGGGANDAFVARLRGDTGTLVYSCRIGGSKSLEWGSAVAIDSLGRPTVAGSTNSQDFPSTPNAFDPVKNALNFSAFVLRLSAQGDQLEYSTFLESALGSEAWAVAVAASGSAIVGGQTPDDDFPTTPGAFSTALGAQATRAFVTRIDPSGSQLEWSTFLGYGILWALAVDERGIVTATGEAYNLFPTTNGAFQPNQGSPMYADAFATRLDAHGSGLIWSTYLGGAMTDVGQALALTSSGAVVVTGKTGSDDFPTTAGAIKPQFQPQLAGVAHDLFVTRLDSHGQGLEFSTYLGGQGDEYATGVAVDGSGVVTVAGSTTSSDFPTTPGSWSSSAKSDIDVVVSRMDPFGKKLFYSTYFGGPGDDAPTDMSMEPEGRVAFVGMCYGGGFPTTPGTLSPLYNGGQRDAYAATLDLLLQGVEAYGHSTQACLGPIQLHVTRMPVAGDGSFGFYCSGAPPSTSGWLLIGEPSPGRAPVGGAGIWLDLGKSVQRLAVTIDSQGYAEIPFSLLSQGVGDRFSCQAVFINTLACTGPGFLSASKPLTITVQ